MTLKIEALDPRSLVPAPWNPNVADTADEAKLDASIERMGFFKPVICRELEDGRLQILGGHYRTAAAIRLGHATVPVINLGQIDDKRAREITLIDNGRYGRDDAGALATLIDELGIDKSALAEFLPYDLTELEAITASAKVDLDSLGLDDEDADAPEKPPRSVKTHEVIKFRVALEDSGWIGDLIKETMKQQGMTDGDQMTNAGAALALILNKVRHGSID